MATRRKPANFPDVSLSDDLQAAHVAALLAKKNKLLQCRCAAQTTTKSDHESWCPVARADRNAGGEE